MPRRSAAPALTLLLAATLLACSDEPEQHRIDLPTVADDLDADGVDNALDNCAVIANPGQADCNADGIGDACSPGDCDGDGVEDMDDNCVSAANPSQADADADGLGDACD